MKDEIKQANSIFDIIDETNGGDLDVISLYLTILDQIDILLLQKNKMVYTKTKSIIEP